MTFRENLADWISGGAVVDAKWISTVERTHRINAENAILEIHDYTAPQKSGTAQKVTRMCKEALK